MVNYSLCNMRVLLAVLKTVFQGKMKEYWGQRDSLIAEGLTLQAQEI